MQQTDPLIGQLVSGRYRVKQVLGTGGMGQVYLAEHEAIQKNVALKVLHLHYSRKADIVTRFRQEAISASRIKHPNVLEVFDFGQLEDGSFFLAMEFLEGCDLADDLKRRRHLDPTRALAIALQICRALAAAHTQGVVHRDMKPENVFLQKTPDGEEIVKIVDFGIAQLRENDDLPQDQPKRRLTKTGMIFGTPEYMAPEQAAGRPIDHRVDVYAVGVILYELFSGAVPFTGDSFLEVLNKHLSEPPPKMSSLAPGLSVSPELELAVDRALQKRPEDRYASMGEFAQALLNTPEGQAFGALRLSSAPPDLAAARYSPSLSPGAETSPQFHQSNAPTLAAPTTGSVDARTASSDTQLEGTHAAGVPRANATGFTLALALGGLGLLGAVGIAAFVLLKQGTSPQAPLAEAPSADTPPTPSLAPPPEPPAPPEASAAQVSPTTQVSLNVISEPSGALLFKGGFQVCDSTPCEVTAAVDEQLELEARKDDARGTARVLAQRDQTVTIKLEAPKPKPAAPRSHKPPRKGPEQPALCEVEVDGLKILRPCK